MFKKVLNRILGLFKRLVGGCHDTCQEAAKLHENERRHRDGR